MESEEDKSVEHTVKGHSVEALVAKLGAGCLYRARHRESDDPVLLFTLQYDTVNHGPVTDAFFERLDQLDDLKIQHVAEVEESGITDEKRPFFVSPYRDLTPLTPGSFQRESGPSNPIKVLTFVRQIAQTLLETNRHGLVHYNLRPNNILLTKLKNLMFTDLAVPPFCSPTAVNIEGLSATQLDYASPEQLEGSILTPISNVYSMGVILYEQLAGFAPPIPSSGWDIFERRNLPQEVPLQEARKELTPATYAVVRDALWRQEWSRTETIELFLNGLNVAIEAEEQLAQKRSKRPAWQFWKR